MAQKDTEFEYNPKTVRFDQDVPSWVKRKYDEALSWLVSELWQNTLKVISSGFGKGGLFGLGATYASFGLMGALSASGSLMGGLAAATTFLSAGGFAFPIIMFAGTLGAISEIRHHRDVRFSKQVPAAPAAVKEKEGKAPSRAIEKHAEQYLETAQEIENAPAAKNFTEAEMKRRNAQQQQTARYT